MAYTVEAGRVVFDEAPAEGAEVEIVVSTTNNQTHANAHGLENRFFLELMNKKTRIATTLIFTVRSPPHLPYGAQL